MKDQMRAIVIKKSGGHEVLGLEERSIPTPEPGWVLIQVKAFGLNRSELFTRQGYSPSVQFPRILGIEAVGVVVAAPPLQDSFERLKPGEPESNWGTYSGSNTPSTLIARWKTTPRVASSWS